MSVKERKERERDEMRELILNAADEIVEADGIGSLSVRKIGKIIEYSPAIIYHYFRDKDDIVDHLMQRNYKKILGAVSSAQISATDPAERMKEMARNYINLALQRPNEYKTIMLSSSPAILEHNTVLFRGAGKKRPAIGMLCQALKEIYKDAEDEWIELTVQVLWASLFGLTMRLLIESDNDLEHRGKLIEHHLKCIVDGMILGKQIGKDEG